MGTVFIAIPWTIFDTKKAVKIFFYSSTTEMTKDQIIKLSAQTGVTYGGVLFVYF